MTDFTAEDAVEMWNEMAERNGLPVVRFLNKTRRNKVRLRLKDAKDLGELREIWQEALDLIEVSAWCHGENDRGWKANFDYLLQESSFAKVMEGRLGEGSKTEGEKIAERHPETWDHEEWKLMLGSPSGFIRDYTIRERADWLPHMPKEIKVMYGFLRTV